MKKILFACLAGFASVMNAQNSGGGRTCGTPILPQQFEGWLNSLAANPSAKPGSGSGQTQSLFNIPVIVHIIHNAEPVNSLSATSGNNINAAQVIDQINLLNQDFNGNNADTILIPTIFKPVLGKFGVNFCLAVVNPTGGVLAEPGIDRVDGVAKGWTAPPYTMSYVDLTIKANTIWDPNRYLNIWLCPLAGNVAGYAVFPSPGTSGLQGLSSPFGTLLNDGVVVQGTFFGSIGTAQAAPYNKGRTLTHELGHWLGLRHTWGDSNCGTDYCNDTPPSQNSNFGCPSYPYKLGYCTGNTTGEMTMNYMDYTDDACAFMFTADQKNRAQLVLTNSPMRAALITSTVCNLPGILDAGISFVSSPVYSQTVCSNFINPVVNLTNFGGVSLTSAVLIFNVDGVNTQTLSWNGSLAPNSSTLLTLPQVALSNPGNHVFNVTVSLPNGGTDANTSNNANTQNFSMGNYSFNAPSGQVCLGNSVVLTASGASSYTWSTGAQTASVSVSPSVTSVYTVTASNGSCSAVQMVTVTVGPPQPSLLVFNTTVCYNQPAIVTAFGASSYLWNTGVNTSSIVVTLSSSAVYTVIGYNSPACFSSNAVNVVVAPLPSSTLVPVNASCGNCANGLISATASGGTPPYSYTWMPGNANGAFLSGVTTGCYTVSISDVFGCQSANSACIDAVALFEQVNKTMFTKLLPNPTSGEFELELGTETSKVEIFDALGRLVQQSAFVSGSVKFDLSNEPDGVFFVKITAASQREVIKLIKE